MTSILFLLSGALKMTAVCCIAPVKTVGPGVGDAHNEKLYLDVTFRHRAFSIEDKRFATLQRTLFIYLINKHISLSDICLTVHH